MGQTKRHLMDRMREHFLSITKQDTNYILGAHFSSNNHNGLTDVTIHEVDFIHLPADSPKAKVLRDRIELNWIHRLSTALPFGLNAMD